MLFTLIRKSNLPFVIRIPSAMCPSNSPENVRYFPSSVIFIKYKFAKPKSSLEFRITVFVLEENLFPANAMKSYIVNDLDIGVNKEISLNGLRDISDASFLSIGHERRSVSKSLLVLILFKVGREFPLQEPLKGLMYGTSFI